MDVILYSTGCPKCKVLKQKLNAKHIAFSEICDVKEMVRLGMRSAPALLVDDELLDFSHAITWINNWQEGCQ